MKVLSRRTVLFCAVAALGLMTGCDRHQKSEKYFLIANNVDLPYWQTANDGLQKAATEYGVTAEMDGPSTFDPQAEVQAFRAAVAKKPAGILVSVADANLMTPEIDSAVSSGIPVITIDSDAPDSHRLYFIGTNNLQAGRIGGARVARQLNGRGNVVFFSMPGQPNLDERLKGYEDAFSKFPAINVVEIFDMKGNSGSAMDKAEEYLARTGKNKIDALVCLEASAGKDVAEAMRRSHVTGRTLVAMDVDPATLNLVKEGIIDATLSQKPYTMALYGLKGLDDVHHYPVKNMAINYSFDPFAPFPAFVDTGVSLVDKTNVENVLSKTKGK
jgi:ribose transport system substrate-binding protein